MSPTCSLMCSLVCGIQFELNNTFYGDKSALIYKKVCVTSRSRCFAVRVSTRPPDVMAKTSTVGSGLWNVWREAYFSIRQFYGPRTMRRLNLRKMDFRGALAKQHRFRIWFQEITDRNTTEVKQKKEHVSFKFVVPWDDWTYEKWILGAP